MLTLSWWRIVHLDCCVVSWISGAPHREFGSLLLKAVLHSALALEARQAQLLLRQPIRMYTYVYVSTEAGVRTNIGKKY